METTNSTERRRFFRIEDRLQLALHRRPDADRGAGASAAERLADIDRRMAAIVAAARVQAPAVGELAELLNCKLDFVIDALQLRDPALARTPLAEQEVSISACGLGLPSGEAFAPGDALVVELLLPPHNTHLRLPARVVRAREAVRGGSLLRLEFAGIGDDEQEMLIQFVVRRQGQFLQRLREQRDARPARLSS